MLLSTLVSIQGEDELPYHTIVVAKNEKIMLPSQTLSIDLMLKFVRILSFYSHTAA